MDIGSYFKKLKQRKDQSKDTSNFKNKISTIVTDLKKDGFEFDEQDNYLVVSPFTCNLESLFTEEESSNIKVNFFNHKDCLLRSAFLNPVDIDSFKIVTIISFPAEYLNDTNLLEFLYTNFSFGDRIVSLRLQGYSQNKIDICLETYFFYDSSSGEIVHKAINFQQSKAFKIIKCFSMFKQKPGQDVFSSILEESQAIAFQDSEAKPWIKYLPTINKTVKNYEDVVKFLTIKNSPLIKTEYFDFDVLFLKSIIEVNNKSKEFLTILKQYDGSDLTSVCLIVKDPELKAAMNSRKFVITMAENLIYMNNEFAEFSIFQTDPCLISHFYTPRENPNYQDRLFECIENLIYFTKLQLEVSIYVEG